MHGKLACLRLALALSVPIALLSGCLFRKPAQNDDYFAHWSKKHRTDIIAYQHFLDRNGVGQVIPMPQLLKSARDWKKCRAEPFTMPPRVLWPHLVPTLQAVRQFKADGILVNPVAASVYRDPVLNACAGGSPGSKHMQLSAIDFDIEADGDSLNTLCNAWRTLGPELKLGLGFYTPTRIHLDTLGYRSWGSDHTRKTSLCLQSN